MTNVNLSGTFKKDARPFNGLTAVVDDLLDETKQRKTYLVVAEVRSHGYQFTAEDGVKTPTVKLDSIEVVLDDADAKVVRELLERLYNARTGGEKPAELPYDQGGEGDAFDAEGWAKEDAPKGGKKKS